MATVQKKWTLSRGWPDISLKRWAVRRACQAVSGLLDDELNATLEELEACGLHRAGP